MIRKTLVGASLIVITFVVAGVALAQDAMHSKETTMPSSVMMMHPPKPMILTVSNSGHGLLRGVVQSVSASSISVAGWGGTWTVNTTSNTKISPAGGLSAIPVGHFVEASGSVSEDSPTITADRVRDWSAKNMMMKDNHMKSKGTDGAMHQ